MKTFDEIFALATSPLHREYAETFTDPRLSWGVGVTQGVAVAMQEMQAEIDALKAERDALLAAQQWRDIESAPTTGYFKAWHGIWACEITVCFIADGTRSWLIEKTKTTKWPVDAFTRWQPLPPPPEAIAKATGEKS